MPESQHMAATLYYMLFIFNCHVGLFVFFNKTLCTKACR